MNNKIRKVLIKVIDGICVMIRAPIKEKLALKRLFLGKNRQVYNYLEIPDELFYKRTSSRSMRLY